MSFGGLNVARNFSYVVFDDATALEKLADFFKWPSLV